MVSIRSHVRSSVTQPAVPHLDVDASRRTGPSLNKLQQEGGIHETWQCLRGRERTRLRVATAADRLSPPATNALKYSHRLLILFLIVKTAFEYQPVHQKKPLHCRGLSNSRDRTRPVVVGVLPTPDGPPPALKRHPVVLRSLAVAPCLRFESCSHHEKDPTAPKGTVGSL